MQTEKSLHSPLPWIGTLDADIDTADGKAIARVFADADHDQTIRLSGPTVSVEEAIANRDFIIKAVNNHYQLVELLKRTAVMLGVFNLDPSNSALQCDIRLMLEAVSK